MARGRHLPRLSRRPFVDPLRAAAGGDSGLREDPHPARRAGLGQHSRRRRKTRRTRSRGASLRSARPRTAVARPAPQGQGDARPPERIAAVRRRIGRGAWGPLPIFYRFAVCAVRRKSPSPLLLPISGRMRAVVSNSENALRLSVRRFLNLHCHAGVLES